MKFSVDKRDKYLVFTVNEDKINSTLTPILKSELILINADGNKNVVFDLSEVKYTDSSGISVFLLGHKLCKDANGIFILTGISVSVEKVLKITQLYDIFTIIPTVAEAIEYIFMEEIERELLDI
jgi:anti-sigma B factor antagonist